LVEKLKTGEYINDTEHIEYFKAKALTLEPDANGKEGKLVLDGEHWDYLPIALENHRGMLTVYCQSSQKLISYDEIQAILAQKNDEKEVDLPTHEEKKKEENKNKPKEESSDDDDDDSD
jgi:hypothetical protein